jgi:hypothetical protein
MVALFEAEFVIENEIVCEATLEIETLSLLVIVWVLVGVFITLIVIDCDDDLESEKMDENECEIVGETVDEDV